MGKGLKFGIGGGGSSIKNGPMRRYYAKDEDVLGGMFCKRGVTNQVSLLGDIFDGYGTRVLSEKVTKDTYIVCLGDNVSNAMTTSALKLFLIKVNSDMSFDILDSQTVRQRCAGRFNTFTKLTDTKFAYIFCQTGLAQGNVKEFYYNIITISNNRIQVGEIGSFPHLSTTGGSNNSFHYPDAVRVSADRLLFAKDGYIYLLQLTNGNGLAVVSSIRKTGDEWDLRLVQVDENKFAAIDSTGYATALKVYTITVTGDELTNGAFYDIGMMGSLYEWRSVVNGDYLICIVGASVRFVRYNTVDDSYELMFTLNIATGSSVNGLSFIPVHIKNDSYFAVADNQIANIIHDKNNNSANLWYVSSPTMIDSGGATNISGSSAYNSPQLINEAGVLTFMVDQTGSSGAYKIQLAVLLSKLVVENTIPTTTTDLAITFNKCTTRTPGKAYSIT